MSQNVYTPTIDLLLPAKENQKSLVRSITIMFAASMFIAIMAQLTIPMFPVPMTMQPFAVMVVALMLPWRLAAGAVLFYLAEGLMGIPVFASMNAGPAVLMGPTSGYLFGYIPAAILISFLCSKGADKSIISRSIAVFFGCIVQYTCGILVLNTFVASFQVALESGLYPFVIGAFVKIIIAATSTMAIHRYLKQK
jgi:biotin transport system substrate-specific component